MAGPPVEKILVRIVIKLNRVSRNALRAVLPDGRDALLAPFLFDGFEFYRVHGHRVCAEVVSIPPLRRRLARYRQDEPLRLRAGDVDEDIHAERLAEEGPALRRPGGETGGSCQ